MIVQTGRPCRLQNLRRQGIAAAEFALLAPLLFFLVLGLIEMGRAIMVKVTLANAARKGCRTGIMAQKSTADIQSEVMNIMTDNGYDSTKFNPPQTGFINITITDPDGNSLTEALDAPMGSVISVQVGIPVSSTMWVTHYLSPSQLESETVIMMKQ